MSNLLKNFVGIDISKHFFDVAVLKQNDLGSAIHQQFPQSPKGFSALKQWLSEMKITFTEYTLFCMEYTGIYNTALLNYLCSEKALVWVEMATRIKKSQGFERGSNDKTDAIKIAWYAFRYQEKRHLWSPTDENLNKLKRYITQRDRIVTTIKKLLSPVNELKDIGCSAAAKELEALQKPAILKLKQVKQNIEKVIEELVAEDKTLNAKVMKVASVKGIGKITAIALLVYTKGFTSFQNAKELACYCGVVPFIKKQSGVSVKSKARVSSYANKKLKWLLHLCALSAMRFDIGLRTYYERKVKEGKHKMSVINAIRNKLILRMFAVLRDDRNYIDNYEIA